MKRELPFVKYVEKQTVVLPINDLISPPGSQTLWRDCTMTQFRQFLECSSFNDFTGDAFDFLIVHVDDKHWIRYSKRKDGIFRKDVVCHPGDLNHAIQSDKKTC